MLYFRAMKLPEMLDFLFSNPFGWGYLLMLVFVFRAGWLVVRYSSHHRKIFLVSFALYLFCVWLFFSPFGLLSLDSIWLFICWTLGVPFLLWLYSSFLMEERRIQQEKERAELIERMKEDLR